MRIPPICACVFAADGCEACSRFACCPRVEAPLTLRAPQALAAVFLSNTAPTSLVVYEKRAVTPYNASQRRHFSLASPLLPPKYGQSLPAAARVRSNPGESFAPAPASRPTDRLWKHRENGCSVLLCLHLLLRSVHMSTDKLLVTERHPAVYRRRSVVLAHHACPP